MKQVRRIVALVMLCFFGGCIQEEVTDFNFSISNPGSITLEPGKTKEVEIFVRGLSVDAQKVYVSVSGLPFGVTAKIDSPRGIPGFYCKVIYAAASNAAFGNYNFQVAARSEKGKVQSYSSELKVIPFASCVERFAGPVNVAQDRDSSYFFYNSAIACKASDSGLFYIENFANRHIKVKGIFDCTSEIIEIPEQVLGTTIIRGSGRVLADSLFIMGSLQDGAKVEHVREFYLK